MWRTLWIACLLALAAKFFSPDSSQATSAAPEMVILDTDIGDDIDDAFAVALALSSPELRLLGITSAWGDTALRSRLLDRLLCETGRQAVPVLTGIPTHRPGAAAFSQRGWAEAFPNRPHGDAVSFLLAQARLHPGKITLIAIAPLSNIGAAIDRDPGAFRLLKRVVLMGGSLYRGYEDEGGPVPNPVPSAEYNIAMDPVSARKLFHSGVPIVMLPLDSTQIALGPDRMAQLTAIDTPLTDSLQALTKEWSSATHRARPTLFDPVTVAYVLDPASCPVTPISIEVDDRGFTRPSPVNATHPANASACLAPHPERLFSLLMPRLLHQRLDRGRSCHDAARPE